MSSGTDDNTFQASSVDVDVLAKENAEISYKTCDSGVETSDSCSATLSTLPTSGQPSTGLDNKQVSVNLSIRPDNTTNIEICRFLSTPESISPDINDTTDDLLNLEEFSIDKNDSSSLAVDLTLDIDTNFSLEVKTDDQVDNNAVESTESYIKEFDDNINDQEAKNQKENQKENDHINNDILDKDNIINIVLNNDLFNQKENVHHHDVNSTNIDDVSTEIFITNALDNVNHKILDFQESLKYSSSEKSSYITTSSDKNLTTSTVSLNEQHTDAISSTMSKSSYSKSAENLSLTHSDNKLTDNLNFSQKDLNKEKILNEFGNQKTKAAATQKITSDVAKNIPETSQTQLDTKYSRLPKELLPQDLGSLVKNVHGIFSSVSGSLKYAYNQTQKAPKAHIKNVVRPIPNGKLMDDIFEDDSEKITVPGHQNAAEKLEKLPINTNVQYSDVKKEESALNLNLENKNIEDDCKKDVYKLQIESLERVLAEQRKENALLRERVKQQVDELQARDQTFKELEVKVDLMSKRVEQSDREKDAAVMRYASVECATIEAKRAAERATLAEKAAHAEMELLSNKLKSAHQEKQRICQLYDDKCHELSTTSQELNKVREDLKELEGRLKWTQSKLRMEIDAYKDSSERAEKLSQQVAALEAAKDVALTNATDLARAKQLEQDLKESQAALILCKHEKQDLERRLSNTTQQLDTCKKERDSAASGLRAATAEVERLKECNLRLEEEAAELAALRAQAALADTLSAQLQRESERASQAEEALSLERARAETCALREAAALQHAATLTAHHVRQRANTADTTNKVQALEVENESLRERISSLEAEVTRLQTALSEEADKRNKETRALARKVAEITEEAAEANKKLEWEKGENGVLKKKHANAIKELNRELHRTLKRCEQLEAKLPPPEPANRTGSISSLSSGEGATPVEISTQNGHSPDSLPDIQVREPDRQALIERIVSLQRAAARRAERCEFLEEHARQLTGELRGKARLLRHLLCSLPAGAVASSQSDAHKCCGPGVECILLDKTADIQTTPRIVFKEIARLGGGAMAAVWGGEATGMTLELSLEMNNKLQAVLEDALLKNITLKENMDTLGEEIARLKGQKNSSDTKS